MTNFPTPTLIEKIAIADLIPYLNNARVHPDEQVAQVTRSIEIFGFTLPILIDDKNEVIAGHARLLAAKKLGLLYVPVIRLKGLSKAQVKAYRIADNKLAENSTWNNELLGAELLELHCEELDFELTDIGFDMPEINMLMGDHEVGASATDEADAASHQDIPDIPASKPGDIFLLGKHRLMCGSALDKCDMSTLMAGELASYAITDPPYNVKIANNVSRQRKIGEKGKNHGEFVMASGEMSREEFVGFLTTSFEQVAKHTEDGAIVVVFMDWRHVDETIEAGSSAFTELKNICVWAKTNGGMGSLYRSAHEFALIFKSGTAKHINNIQLGAHGRYRTNVWNYAGGNSFGADRDQALDMHPTVKPVGMIADAILDCSNRGDIVLDPFAGSGSTIIAAERSGRMARAMELDPIYVDVCLRRFQRVTGIEPIHQETGLTFDALKLARSQAFEADNHSNYSSHIEGATS